MKEVEQPAHSPVSGMGSATKAGCSSSFSVAAALLLFHRWCNGDEDAKRPDEVAVDPSERRTDPSELRKLAMEADLNMATF